MTTPARDLMRIALTLFFIGGLTLASLWILEPFLLALTWATMIVVSTWPLQLRVQRWLGNRRILAVCAMTLAMVMVFVVPLVAAISMVIDNAHEIGQWVVSLGSIHLPSPPDWLKSVPFVGANVDATWRDIVTAGPEDLVHRLKPYAHSIVAWIADHAGGFGKLALQLLLTMVLAAVLYANGEAAATLVRRFAARLAANAGRARCIWPVRRRAPLRWGWW